MELQLAVMHRRGTASGCRSSSSQVGYFAALSSGELLTSQDGRNWQSAALFPSDELNAITMGNDLAVVVGTKGVILTSTNLIDWERPLSPTTNYLRDVTFGGGTYLAVGDHGTIIGSTNGVDWVAYPSSTDELLFHTVYGRGTFMVFGFVSTVLQSNPLFEIGVRADEPGNLFLSGETGETYRIEYRQDFQPALPWQPLATLTLTNSPQSWMDVDASARAQRFYRLVLP